MASAIHEGDRVRSEASIRRPTLDWLGHMAVSLGLTTDVLIGNIIECEARRYLDEETAGLEDVRHARAAIEREDFVSHDEVGRMIEEWNGLPVG